MFTRRLLTATSALVPAAVALYAYSRSSPVPGPVLCSGSHEEEPSVSSMTPIGIGTNIGIGSNVRSLVSSENGDKPLCEGDCGVVLRKSNKPGRIIVNFGHVQGELRLEEVKEVQSKSIILVDPGLELLDQLIPELKKNGATQVTVVATQHPCELLQEVFEHICIGAKIRYRCTDFTEPTEGSGSAKMADRISPALMPSAVLVFLRLKILLEQDGAERTTWQPEALLKTEIKARLDFLEAWNKHPQNVEKAAQSIRGKLSRKPNHTPPPQQSKPQTPPQKAPAFISQVDGATKNEISHKHSVCVGVISCDELSVEIADKLSGLFQFDTANSLITSTAKRDKLVMQKTIAEKGLRHIKSFFCAKQR